MKELFTAVDAMSKDFNVPPQVAWFLIGFITALIIAFIKSKVTFGNGVAGRQGLNDLSSLTFSGFSRESLLAEAHGKEVPPAIMNKVMDHIRNGRKIEAIKELREATNLGLAEAKIAVEAIEKKLV